MYSYVYLQKHLLFQIQGYDLNDHTMLHSFKIDRNLIHFRIWPFLCDLRPVRHQHYRILKQYSKTYTDYVCVLHARII